MTHPILHLFAGPNGAGKSTLYRALVDSGTLDRGLVFVNADLYEQSHLQNIADLQKRSEAAREWADAQREALMEDKLGFVSETVFSHESKLSLVSHAQSLGYHVVLYIVSVNNPQQLLARVRQRVQEGGHHVPPRRILERYPRTMANLKKAVRLADLALVYDGAEVERGAHSLVAVCKGAQTTLLVKKLPPWATAMLVAD